MPAWTAESDRKLLIAIISILSPSPPKWDEVVKKLGNEVTAEAVRQRYQKLRKTAEAELAKGITAGENGDTPSPATPSKRKRQPPAKKASKGKTKAVLSEETAPVSDDDDKDVDSSEGDAKKRKLEEGILETSMEEEIDADTI